LFKIKNGGGIQQLLVIAKPRNSGHVTYR